MENKENNVSSETKTYFRYQTLLNLFIFALCSMFLFNSIKIMFDLAATVMGKSYLLLPIIFTYLLPVVHFIGFFIGSYVKSFKLPYRIIFLVVSFSLIIYNFIGIGLNFDIYSSNNGLGIYESLPSVGFSFPFDGIAINIILTLLNVYNIALLIKPNMKLAYIRQSFKYYGYFKFQPFEIIFIVIIALISMFFLGDFASGLFAVQNTSISGGLYLFLLISLLMPTVNFVYFLINPSIRDIKKRTKIILYSVGIGLNLLFLILYIAFEAAFPTFVMRYGSMLFPLDSIVNVPLGCYFLLVSFVVSIVIYIHRLIKSL